jgi:hypothetical protein
VDPRPRVIDLLRQEAFGRRAVEDPLVP